MKHVRELVLALSVVVPGAILSHANTAAADDAKGKVADSRPTAEGKPWCGPEMTELSDHVCFAEPGPPPEGSDGRRTLLIYLHGSLAPTPGFQYVQQHWMAQQAKRRNVTVLMPTAPETDYGYQWPSPAAQKAEEPRILETIRASRKALEARNGAPFDETFVLGFSSGAYYASSLAIRSALDVDGYIVLAGGSSWMRPAEARAVRAPVFVGVSAADPQTADHSRAFANTLASLGWTYRVEERDVGHAVDEGFLVRGMRYLKARTRGAAAARAALAEQLE
jgi:predicted esterase